MERFKHSFDALKLAFEGSKDKITRELISQSINAQQDYLSELNDVTTLVLTRRKGDKIYIGNGIIIRIAEIGNSTLRLAITAPRTTQILREELKESK